VVINGGSSVRPRSQLREPYSGLYSAAASGGGTTATNLIPAPTFDIRAAITDPLGYSIFFSLNRFGSPQVTYTPLTPRSDSAQYDDATGLVTRTVSSTRAEMRYTWDVGGKLTNVKNVTLGTHDSTVYAAQFALPVQTISDNSEGEWLTYDQTKTGWPLQYSRAGSSTATPTTYYPDALGRDTAVVDPAGHRTSMYPAASGLQNTDSVRAPNTQVTWFKRDTLGHVVATRQPTGAVDTLALDVLNRTTWTIPPMGGTTQYQYDELNNITAVTDAKNQVYTVQRNVLGWVTKLISPTSPGDSTVYRYDAAGTLVYARSHAGRVITFEYDSLYRMTKKISAAEHDTITYAYKTDTIVARSVSRGTLVSTDTIFTDSLGRTVKEQTVRPGSANAWYVSSHYNAADPGRTWVKAYQNGNATAQAGATNYYYANKQLWAIELLSFSQTLFGYNVDQQDSTVTQPSGLKETWLYTSSHALARRQYSVAAVESVFDRAYRTDTLARLVERQNGTAGQFQNFYYDLKGRFNFWEKWSQGGTPTCVNVGGYGYDCSSGATRTFQLGTSYDNVNNHTDLGAVLQTGNRLTAYNGFNLTYDADGNMVKRIVGATTDSLDWDDFGQLKSVIRSGTAVATFDYDGFGRRVRKVAGGTTIQYVWDGDQIILEADASGVTTQAYTYYPGTDRLHSVTAGGATYYASIEPATGDVNGLIKAVGDTVKAQYNYTPWGGFDTPDQPTINGGRVNSFRWKGLPYDTETGLYYVRARHYDPQLRRFITEDPNGLEGGINQYAFAGGDPINASDPFGADTTHAQTLPAMGASTGEGPGVQPTCSIGETASDCTNISEHGNGGYDGDGAAAVGENRGNGSGASDYGERAKEVGKIVIKKAGACVGEAIAVGVAVLGSREFYEAGKEALALGRELKAATQAASGARGRAAVRLAKGVVAYRYNATLAAADVAGKIGGNPQFAYHDTWFSDAWTKEDKVDMLLAVADFIPIISIGSSIELARCLYKEGNE
jgi:RHS repeat-associated protein